MSRKGLPSLKDSQAQAGIPVKQCLKLPCLKENWRNFGFSSETPISKFVKIHPVVFQLKYMEGQMDQPYNHVGYGHVVTWRCTIQRSIELRSLNNCCHWKAKYVTYSDCVFIVLGIQRAMQCHLWSVRLHNIFSHYLTEGRNFGKNVIGH